MRKLVLALFVSCAAAGEAPAQQIAVPAVPAVPRGSLDRLISNQDYPASAMRAGETGVVEATLTVGLNGRVTHCTVVVSSGSAALDSATCRLLRARARFTPARDSDGAPRYGAAAVRIVWGDPQVGASAAPQVHFPPVQPPRPRAPLASLIGRQDYSLGMLGDPPRGPVELRLAVDAIGRVEGCTITRSSGSSAIDSATCRLLRQRARFTPAVDPSGNLTAGEVWTRIDWPPPPERLPRRN
jgi:TonB family protein